MKIRTHLPFRVLGRSRGDRQGPSRASLWVVLAWIATAVAWVGAFSMSTTPVPPFLFASLYAIGLYRATSARGPVAPVIAVAALTSTTAWLGGRSLSRRQRRVWIPERVHAAHLDHAGRSRRCHSRCSVFRRSVGRSVSRFDFAQTLDCEGPGRRRLPTESHLHRAERAALQGAHGLDRRELPVAKDRDAVTDDPAHDV